MDERHKDRGQRAVQLACHDDSQHIMRLKNNPVDLTQL
jgi:hypothetical protein